MLPLDRTRPAALAAAAVLLSATVVVPATAQAPASPRSVMAQTLDHAVPQQDNGNAHALIDNSMFAILPPEVREFREHDLVEIIVRESSRTQSKQELDAQKDWGMDGFIDPWPDFRLDELLQLQIRAGRTDDNPVLRMGFNKDFQGDGEYKRQDDMTARLSAEILEILPNGNLVLEARTEIINDEEQATIKVTGVCRADDITPANTILSGQIHDLSIEKINKGELKKANQKGLLAKLFETIFAF